MRVGDSDSDSVDQTHTHTEEGTDLGLNSQGDRIDYQEYATPPTQPSQLFMQQLQECGRLHLRSEEIHSTGKPSAAQEPDVVLSGSEGHATRNPHDLGISLTKSDEVKDSDDDDADQPIPRGHAVGGEKPKKKQQTPPRKDPDALESQENFDLRMEHIELVLRQLFPQQVATQEQTFIPNFPPFSLEGDPGPDPDLSPHLQEQLEELTVELSQIFGGSAWREGK